MQEAGPEVFELLARHVERWNDPRRYLLDYIDGLIKVMSERSSGGHGGVLNELNNWVRAHAAVPSTAYGWFSLLREAGMTRREVG